MGDKPRDADPLIKSDRLVLDFGKTILRPDQGGNQPETKRKPTRVPGPAPEPDFVTDDEILNRRSEPDRDQ